MNCRGTIEPKIEDEIREKIASGFTYSIDKLYNEYTGKPLFSDWSEVEPETEKTAEEQLNSSEDNTVHSAYIEYIKNRAAVSKGNSLNIKRKYAVEFPDLDEIMLYVTPVTSGESDTLDNLNNEMYQAAYKRYLKNAESGNKKIVNYNTFLNTTIPVINKIRKNREEVNADVFEYFSDADMEPAKEAAEYADSVSAIGGPPFILVKKIYDKIFFAVPELADSWKNSLIDDELEKDGLLGDDSEKIDINEILDMAANAAAEAVIDALDFVNIGGNASSVSGNLYSAAKEEAKDAAEKKIADEAKDAAVNIGKKILEKEAVEIAKDIMKQNIDESALKHSTIGSFTINPKTGDISRMKGGGHGQSNIEMLEKNGFEYEIVKKYNNGVRVGNVKKHKTPEKRIGLGQAWFPEKWSDDMIKKAGEYVADLPENIDLPDGSIGYGEYNGVRVGIIKTNGKIGTIFPDANVQP